MQRLSSGSVPTIVTLVIYIHIRMSTCCSLVPLHLLHMLWTIRFYCAYTAFVHGFLLQHTSAAPVYAAHLSLDFTRLGIRSRWDGSSHTV